MTTLLHPATAFAQKLTFDEVQFKDMTAPQQTALWLFMHFQGDGVWGENGVDCLADAVEKYGDVRFGVGKFANTDELKLAIISGHPDFDQDGDMLATYDNEVKACSPDPSRALPVLLNHDSCAAEFGLFEWGYEYFWGWWCYQPETEFIRFLPDWNPDDDTGRGGQ
jgi:hypothetical protein